MNDQERALYHRPDKHRLESSQDPRLRRSRVLLILLMPASLARIVLLHLFLPMRDQINRLGKGRTLARAPLPESWALYAADLRTP